MHNSLLKKFHSFLLLLSSLVLVCRRKSRGGRSEEGGKELIARNMFFSSLQLVSKAESDSYIRGRCYY